MAERASEDRPRSRSALLRLAWWPAQRRDVDAHHLQFGGDGRAFIGGLRIDAVHALQDHSQTHVLA